MQNLGYSLAAEAAAPDFVFVSDVTSHTGGGGEGAVALVTRKLLQILHNTESLSTSIHLKLYLTIILMPSNYIE